jgi:hypothetical protein
MSKTLKLVKIFSKLFLNKFNPLKSIQLTSSNGTIHRLNSEIMSLKNKNSSTNDDSIQFENRIKYLENELIEQQRHNQVLMDDVNILNNF